MSSCDSVYYEITDALRQDDHRFKISVPLAKRVKDQWDAFSDAIKDQQAGAHRSNASRSPFFEETDVRQSASFYLVAGMAIMMPFNITILTFDQFPFPGWPFQCMIAYSLPLLTAQVVGQWFPPRTIWRSLASLSCCCMLMPVLLRVHFAPPVAHVLALGVVVLIAISCAASQLTTFSRAVADDHGVAISIGTGIAGPIATLMAHSVDGFFIAATITLICACWSEYRMPNREINEFWPSAISPATVSTVCSVTMTGTPSRSSKRPELSMIEQSPWRIGICTMTMFFSYIVSGFCFPSMTVHWIPRVIENYQVWDFVGRCIPLLWEISWSIGPPIAFLRALFIPVVCMHSTIDYTFRLVLLDAFAFSNGFITSIMLAQGCASPSLGRNLSLAISFGLSAGSLLAISGLGYVDEIIAVLA